MTRLLTVFLLAISSLVPVAHAQVGVYGTNAANPDQLHPYIFSNLIWWDDDTLRGELKHRIPSLPDELKLNSPIELRMINVLTEMLKQKGIHAEVQVLEPSPGIDPSKCAPSAPCTAIVFSILAPPNILIGPIDVQGLTSGSSEFSDKLNSRFEGKPYARNSFWMYEEDITTELHNSGYIEATVSFTPGPPSKNEAGYVVPLHIAVRPGDQYRVGSVKVDGGPLLKGRDISSDFSIKPGDLATDNATGMDRKFALLRDFYERAGYADVVINNSYSVDKATQLVSYNITVTPGSIYHLASLQVTGLTPAQKDQLRKIFSLQVGDIYDSNKITSLYRAINAPSSSLAGYEFSFSPMKNKANATIDLTLVFNKKP